MPKPSTERVRAVLEELYALDPSLRAHGPALEQAVTTLLAAKPNIRINPTFAAKLREQLAASPQSHTTSSMNTSSLRIWLPTAAVATAVLVVAVVVMQPQLFGLSRMPQADIQTSPIIPGAQVSISRIDGRAFGELFASASTDLGASPETISARPQSGSGGAGLVPPAMPLYPVSENAVAQSDSKIMIAPAPDSDVYERPRYNYEGELPERATSGDVYRRVKTPITGIGGALTTAHLGFLDLGKFTNAKLTQFSITQPDQYGYQVFVDMNEGSANIGQNWATWLQPVDSNQPLSATEVPEDNAIIAIANTFLERQGIATTAYGTPVVDRRWSVVQPYMRGTEAVTEDLKIRWAPETITVIYPLELNGMMVYDQSGFPYGLSVIVNVRDGRVNNVWNLTTLNYEASPYDLVTDATQLLDIASRGDQYASDFGEYPNEVIRDLSLGEPTLVLMQTWHTTPNGQGEELLVPALRFPVIPDAEGNTGYREAVMVPLVKDLVEPIYRIMQTGGGTAGASAGMPTPVAPPEPVIDAPVQR